jgi:multidrug resistance efflux pump
MRRMILISLLITVVVLAIVGGGAYWFYNSYSFYNTDDASVSGPLVNISSPQAGQLTTFTPRLGDTVAANQVVGTVTTVVNGAKTVVDITTPIAGTVVQDAAIPGEVVTPGLSLIQIANLNQLNVTAYVDESAINNIKTGQTVDIHIDAYGNTTYTGHVDRIVQATAGIFSLLPASDPTTGNFTKVGQRIPIIISLEGNGGNDLVPGMSAEVTIHLH